MNKNTERNCLNCPNRCFSLFKDLKPQEIEKINDQRETYNYEKNETIYRLGTKSKGLHILSKGKVKVTINNEDGNEFIHSLHGPVDLLGIHDILHNGYYSCSAKTLEDCEICIISLSTLNYIISSNTDLAFKIYKQISKELIHTQARIVAITTKHLRGRLADTLLYVMDKFGNNSKGDFLDVNLKRSEIAALSNMTEANAIRTLSEFNKEGIITLDRKNIRINKQGTLNRISSQGF